MKYESFDILKEDCSKCTGCELCNARNNVVFGVGNENADIMFVGEGPGENEDLQGEPFVGKAGQLLDKYLGIIGLDRNKNIYIANIVKCRPPQNRDPKDEEQDSCIEWLRHQARLIQPKIIVCLGRISAQKLIGKEFRVTQHHGEFIQKGNILFMGTFHPAALLRNPNNKPLALSDFQKLRDKINELSIDIKE
ncbi:MAG: uracil-DNA glycosylase [Oscillospiraceae bacterium]|nr:uracil-DNA glycosylase [Oscillospiraceae bacterium]